MTTQKVIYAKFLQELRNNFEYDDVISKLDPKSNSLCDIFELIWKHEHTANFVNVPKGNPNINKKGDTESEHFRNVGNRLYKERKHDKALLAYNYAILSATHPKEIFKSDGNDVIQNQEINETTESVYDYECLSFAYANRSALLTEMEQYESAINDILYSIKYGYPVAKRYKLLERKCKCLTALKKYDKAISEIEKLLAKADGLELNKKDTDVLKNNLQKLKLKCTEELKTENTIKTEEISSLTSSTNKFKNIFYRGPTDLPKVSNPRLNYPSVSQSVKVRYSPTKGRYLVATDNISPGEVILLEESYSNTLNLGDDLRSYCNYCMKASPVPLPCSTCSLVVFCSESCRNKSLCENGCHQAECKILPDLVAMDTDVDGMLVLRSLLPMPIKKLKEICIKYDKKENSYATTYGNFNESEEDLSEQIFTPSSGDNFDCMFNLEGNIFNRPIVDLLEASISAVLLVKVILNKIKINNIPNVDTDECKLDVSNVNEELLNDIDARQLGGLVLRLLLNFQCNAHCIKELQLKQNELAILSKLAIIGYGVYCNLSLVNHSCNPNVLHSTAGNSKFLYTVSCIKKNEEICDSYGERFVSHTLLDRQESIEKTYHFKCDCIACLNNWPLFNDLPVKFSLKCFKCQSVVDKETSKCNNCQMVYSNKKSDSNSKNKKGKKPKPQPQAQYDATEIRKKISNVWESYNKVTENINKGIIPNENEFQKLKEIVELLDKYSIHPNRPLVQVQEFMMRYFDLNAAVSIA